MGPPPDCRGASWKIHIWSHDRPKICPPGMNPVGVGAAAVCWTDCTGKVDWGAFCTAQSCNPGYDFVAGVCWRNCGGDIDVGALCRQRCRENEGEYEVLGVCWKGCPANTIDVGALCRARCGGSTGNEVAGVCWGSCGGDIDVGALCRKRCREGFHEVAGVCWGNTGTYARESAIPKSTKIYDPGYNPPENLSGISFPYCDFSSQTMLDRMAQFYYDQSSLHAQTVPDDSGRISFEYIVMFYGVIASSELSCDVACRMKTVIFDPITGGRYEQKFGTTYSDDPGNSVSYRRFYFIKQNSDPQGIFTVTACTNSDYTAPDAQSKSTDGGDPIISLPKVYNVRDKRVAMGTWDNNTFKQSLAVTTVNMGLGAAFGTGVGGQVLGAVAGTMAGEAVAKRMSQASGVAASIGATAENSVVKDDSGNYYVFRNYDNYSINFGPLYEIRARDGQGVVPSINFCGKIITTPLLCSNKFILRDTIDLYHTQNPTKRVKRVDIIEPRGRDGCYYQWNIVDYNPTTNVEGTVSTQSEIVRRYQIVDRSTCVFTPTNTFVTDMTGYPIRSYNDLIYKRTQYPTREIKSVATHQGRYVRVRPSQTASDSFMQITQIAVFDSTGNNLALNRPVYATSSYTGSEGPSAPPNTVVNGTFSALSGNTNTWQNNGGNSAQTDYLEIDLGKNYVISHIVYFGRLDNPNPTRNMGIRFQLLYTNGLLDPVVKELTTTADNLSQVVDFCTETLVPKQPVKPFNVPQPLPPEVNLGSSCPARCQDKTQIDEFVKQYNANPANSSAQIIKVMRAVTPRVDRCDFEAQVLRTTSGKRFTSKELISTSVSQSGATTNTGTVYGRYVRVKPPATNGDGFLNISQIAVMDPAGTNIARGRKAYASSLQGGSSPASIVVDGTLSTRAWPNIWHSNTATRATEFWEVDLGISQPISSIVYYGRDTSSNGANPDRNTGVIVEVFNSRDSNAIPVYSGTLASNASPQTLTFRKCNFTFTPIASTGSFIQDNTPFLNSIDTSGGVLTFQSIVKGVSDVFNSVINPIKNSKPLDVLNTNVNSSDTTAKNVLNAAAANIQLTGCPNTKCSDPAVLAAIVNSYNANNSATSSGQFGAETNTITAIAKAGISGPNTCDVMFTNLYSLYDDALYPAVDTETSTMVKRFTLTNSGNCAMSVAPTSVDISMNAFGISPASATLNAPYTTPACQVNCRDAALLSSVRQRLNTQLQTTTVSPNFNTVVQSFASGPATCEYYMQKDVSTRNTATNRITTDTGLDTYVRANFNVNSATCAFTLNSVDEFDPDAITTSTDPVSGTLNSYIKGALVNPPYIMNYDNTTPSTRVNETVQNLS